MPVWNTTRPDATGFETNRESKHFIIERIERDEVVPIVSHDISCQLLFDHHMTPVNHYAKYIHYPFTDQPVLSQLAQFRIVMQKDIAKKDPLAWLMALRTDYI